jgi:hypothetical protein
MAHLDFPEMLILFFLAAGFAWFIYNWSHPDVHSPK